MLARSDGQFCCNYLSKSKLAISIQPPTPLHERRNEEINIEIRYVYENARWVSLLFWDHELNNSSCSMPISESHMFSVENLIKIE